MIYNGLDPEDVYFTDSNSEFISSGQVTQAPHLRAQHPRISLKTSEGWTVDEAVEFYSGTFAIDAELGLTGKVSHETHRNTALFNPYSTAAVLRRVPNLRITADFSHWVVVCERLLDTHEEDKQILSAVIPHVTHIHARMGTTQSSQCPDPTHEVFKEERRFFETVWKQIIDATATASEPITFVPEYG
ncbi:unnamed protein product [Aspergillus oryzae]|uniref:Unnamed protein product n=2 Tax=Aspergillus oryzae TaxID=5062 RepID=A0AAN4YHR1_ASPOZ|nr:unnamed protein product [Aspergillus oryzae]GMF92917.1 unnamed protein product [Aspergillus oryzae]GMG10753.1 unnamed protein product [Aspergillus oryzae]GMG28907.1 unnamed protein product [Aspergillus oryzae]GMG45389.1 unnamed protein product [Aspergillus oryzae var. brunneus]